MTREEAERGLLIHAVHMIFDFLRHKDAELAAKHPGFDMRGAWADTDTLLREFVTFQQQQLEKKVPDVPL
jgi:hypothetical protein